MLVDFGGSVRFVVVLWGSSMSSSGFLWADDYDELAELMSFICITASKEFETQASQSYYYDLMTLILSNTKQTPLLIIKAYNR